METVIQNSKFNGWSTDIILPTFKKFSEDEMEDIVDDCIISSVTSEDMEN